MKKAILIIGVITALIIVLGKGWSETYVTNPDGTISTVLSQDQIDEKMNTLYIKIQQNQGLIDNLTKENNELQKQLDDLQAAITRAKGVKP